MRRWLAAHGEQVSEPAWRADLAGRRTLFWLAYAPYILSARDPVYRSAVLRALARGARHLERTADRAPLGVGADRRLGGRDRLGAGAAGRPGAAGVGRSRAWRARSACRCTTMAA